MGKKELDNKKGLAQILYMNGEQQIDIAEKVGVSKVTVSNWIKKEGWKERRAAKSVTRPELVNKLLNTISSMLDKVSEAEDPALAMSGLGDKLSKIASVIEKLDKKANVVDSIEVFMAFSKWMDYRSSIDSDITPELKKTINRYQDLYINEQVSKK